MTVFVLPVARPLVHALFTLTSFVIVMRIAERLHHQLAVVAILQHAQAGCHSNHIGRKFMKQVNFRDHV